MDKTIVRSALSFLTSSFLIQVVNFVSQMILMKHLSVSEFGKYSLVFESLAMSNMIVTGTFRNFYMKQLHSSVKAENLMPYQFYIGSVWCLISTISVGYMFGLNAYIVSLLSLSLCISSIILPVLVDSLLSGNRRRIIYKDLSFSLINFVFVICFVFTGSNDSYCLVFFILLSNILTALMFFYDKLKLSDILNIKKVKLIKDSLLPFFGVFLINTIYNKIGVAFLSRFSDLTNVALYLATFKFINPMSFIQSSLISSILPKFRTEHNFEFSGKVFAFFTAPGLLVSILLPLILPYVLHMFGLNKYNTIPHLLVYGSSIVFVTFLYGALSNFIAIRGGQSAIITTNLIGVIAFLAMLFAAYEIGIRDKFVELSLACFVITESILCIVYYFFIKKTNQISFLFLLSPIMVVLYEGFLVMNTF